MRSGSSTWACGAATTGRRAKIAVIVRKENFRKAEGLMEACEIFLEEQAQATFDDYSAEYDAHPHTKAK